MKKKGTAKGTAARIAAGFMAVSAFFLPRCNVNESVYGPPPDSPASYNPSDNENETVYGPPPEEEYDPSQNMNEDVYGPPPGEGDW